VVKINGIVREKGYSWGGMGWDGMEEWQGIKRSKPNRPNSLFYCTVKCEQQTRSPKKKIETEREEGEVSCAYRIGK